MYIRKITIEDTENVGQTIYKAFVGIADRHNFPHDFPTLESAVGFAEMTINNPDISGFVAEENGQFLGSNFLWKQNSIAGVGPITVNPDAQSKGAGRKLMEAVIEDGKNSDGIRLVQSAYNSTSMSLYTSLGFDIVEPLVHIEGIPRGKKSANTEVRPLEEKDFADCAELSRKVHGFDRNNELRQTARIFPAFVALRENRVVGYASAPFFWKLNHAVAETVGDLQNLLLGAANLTGKPLEFLLPTRRSELFRWSLNQGLRVIQPLTLMKMGAYQEPRGSYLPSVLY